MSDEDTEEIQKKSFRERVSGKNIPTRESSRRRNLVDGVSNLIYGESNNFIEIERELLVQARLKFGKLGDLIRTLEYYVPEEIEYNLEELENNPMKKEQVKVKVVNREQNILRMQDNRAALYSMMWGILSLEGEEAVRKSEEFDKAEEDLNPLSLWIIIKATHASGVTTADLGVTRHKTRKIYQNLEQYAHESLAMFKQRDQAGYVASIASGNAELTDEDRAFDFMNALDDNRYAKFKCDLLNDRNADSDAFPKTVQEMYLRASGYLVVSDKSSGSYLKTAFVTADNFRVPARRPGGGGRQSSARGTHGRDGRGRDGQAREERRQEERGRYERGPGERTRGGNGGQDGREREATRRATPPPRRPEKPAIAAADGVRQRVPDVAGKDSRSCYNCGRTGHISRNCPARAKTTADDESDEVRDEWEEDWDEDEDFNMTTLNRFNLFTFGNRERAQVGGRCEKAAAAAAVVHRVPAPTVTAAARDGRTCYACGLRGHLSRNCLILPADKTVSAHRGVLRYQDHARELGEVSTMSDRDTA